MMSFLNQHSLLKILALASSVLILYTPISHAADASQTNDTSTQIQSSTTQNIEVTQTTSEQPPIPQLSSNNIRASEKESSTITLLRPGSKLKNPYADLVNLGLTGRNNSNVKSYSEAAAQYCKTARDSNDANAYFALAWLYTNGRGVDKDENIAALFFSKAADLGHASAKTWLTNSKGDISRAIMPTCMLPDPPTNYASVHPEPNQNKNGETKPFYTKGPIYQLVSEIAPRFEVDIDLVMAFIAVESGFNPKATSPMNAQGLMQLIPETAARFNVKDAYDPADNIKGGVKYIQWLLAYFKGDVALVAAAYNAGENAVTRYQGIPPYAETQAYVKKITSLYSAPFHSYKEDLGVQAAIMNVSAKNDPFMVKTTKP